jgi:glycosyltransferase involved in cell wall biosynthesis
MLTADRDADRRLEFHPNEENTMTTAPSSGGSTTSTSSRASTVSTGNVRRSLRIGLLAPPWLPIPPPGYGGTESVIDRLARGLQDAGHEVRLWTTGEATCPVPRRSTFDVACRDSMGNAVFELRQAIEGYEWFEDERCDVVHDHSLVGPLLAHVSMPVITTNHGPFENPELATIYRHTPATIPIIAISRSQAAMARWMGIRISHVIHHGIDVDEIPEGDGRGDERGPYLLFLGRMSPTKGLSEAIDVARSTGSRLVIASKVADPEERRYFEREIAHRCVDGIEFVGEVGGIEKYRLLGGATALVNPIRWPEPFGLVMIEALATGTPVITTPHGAAPEIVSHGDNGLVCADDAALIDAVRSVERIDRHHCRRDVARRFSASLMVHRHLDAYERLLTPDAPWQSCDVTLEAL